MWTFMPSLPMFILRWTPHASHAMLECFMLPPRNFMSLFYPRHLLGNLMLKMSFDDFKSPWIA